MASSSRAQPVEERYEHLGRFYRALWKRFDNVCGESKWLDVRTISEDSLKESARATLAQLQAVIGDSDLFRELLRDYETAERLLSDPAQTRGVKFEEFKEYLRDRGLRYAQRTMSAESHSTITSNSL
jgi:hypothetical protein